jgi:hypothetical protein
MKSQDFSTFLQVFSIDLRAGGGKFQAAWIPPV